MNGFIATLTRLPRRVSRALLITAVSVSSVLLVGAVREARQDPPVATAAQNEANAVLASYLPTDDAPELLVDVEEKESPSIPTQVEILPVPKPTTSQRETVLPSIADRLTPPTLAPRTRVMKMEVTAYCACTKCCGPKAQGITASGKRVSYNGGKFVAADTRLLKFHTKLVIPGYASNQPVPVIDRGGAIKGNKLDVYFPTHQEARQWGRKKIDVLVIEE
jgi:3D (Asp-Asp-Asp) domain-containing protein